MEHDEGYPKNVTPLDGWRQRHEQEKDERERSHERSPENDVQFATLYMHDLVHARHGKDILNTVMADLQEPEAKPPHIPQQTHLFRRHLISITEDEAYDRPLTDHEPYEDLFVAALYERRDSVSHLIVLNTIERLHRVSLSQPKINTTPYEKIPTIINIVLRNTPHDPYAS